MKNDKNEGPLKPVFANYLIARKANYDLSDKILALSFLEASQRPLNDDIIPNYTKTGELLDIPESTLRHWWRDRDKILKQAQTMLATVNDVAIMKLQQETLRLLNSLAEIDYSKVKVRDKAYLLNTLVSKARLMISVGSNGERGEVASFTPVIGKRG